MLVKVLGNRGKFSLIEWVEENNNERILYRSFVRKEDITHIDDLSFCSNPHIGLSYGVPWSSFVKQLFSDKTIEEISSILEKELHRVNIWTVEEAKAKPQLVTSAIQSALAMNSRNLVQLAKDYLERDHGNE